MAKNISLFQAKQIQFATTGRSSKILNINSLQIEEGVCLFIVGENGAGKSTLLSVLGGELVPDSGEIYWKGKRLKPISKRLVPGFPKISLVKQEPALDFFLTVEEQVYKAVRHLPDRELAQRKTELIHLCGLKKLLNQRVGSLSGGEKRRLSIAMALANDVELLLLDEPFSDLDYGNKVLFRAMLLHLKNGRKIAMVVVSHHGEDAYWLADQIFTLEKGKWVEKIHRTLAGFQPASARTARLLGWKNIFKSNELPLGLQIFNPSNLNYVHLPQQQFCFASKVGHLTLGKAKILNAYSMDGKWLILLNINEQLIEMETSSAPVSTEVDLYMNPTNLLWLKD